MENNKLLKSLVAVVALLLLLFAQKYFNQDSSQILPEEETLCNEPSEEQEPESIPNNTILPVAGDQKGIFIEHEGFSLLFDTKTMCPRWVAWELTAEETRGKVSRGGVDFKEDTSVPKEYQVASWDYNGGAYGRGHMCPAGDMKWSKAI